MWPWLFLILPSSVIFVTGKSPKIVIIGAGPAGIAAATRLLENGFTNVTILEAEPRIGGRINSVRFGDANVDLGAQWCHGETNNVVYEKVQNLSLVEHVNYTDKMFHSTRKQLEPEFVKEYFGILDDIDSKMEANASGHVTVGDYCIDIYNRSIYSHFGNDSDKLKIAQDALDFYQLSYLGIEGAFSWFDVAANAQYEECPGDNSMIWKGKGYGIFLDVLMKKHPDPREQLPIDEKISLNKEVNKIVWNSNPGTPAVQIFCSDLSFYDADHVIFTPSIGVLKEKGNSLFQPNLSLKKQHAIKNKGFAASMKVFAYFDEPWWNERPTFGLIWEENDIKKARFEFPGGPHLNGRSWVTYASSTVEEKYNPKVISIWFTGYLVPAIEKLSDDLITAGVHYITDKFFGHLKEISPPTKILKSTWYTNPHFRGTYSFQTIHSCDLGKEQWCSENELAVPLSNSEGVPVVQFAGEATHPYHYSTVHGAVESGYREAKTLIDLYK